MSQQVLEERVGNVERDLARRGQQIDRMEVDVRDIGSGVKQLLERDARRPQALSWASIAGTCGGLAAMAAVVWWLIGSSPAMVDLERRVTRLDDPYIGRVTRIEKDMGWQVRVTKGD